MIVWPGAQGPVVLALFCSDRQIVDAGNSSLHQAVDIEFPVLIAVAAKPIEAVVVPLVSKAHRNTVLTESPNLFDQPVVEFAVPFAGQELDDFLASGGKFLAVAPRAVFRIGQRYFFGIAGIPTVFGAPYLLAANSFTPSVAFR